jgi:site-specific DNA-methyltransferase (adenine-specific)
MAGMHTMADCELALTSFNRNAKLVSLSSQSTEPRIHVTQKPIKLYQWLLTNYAKPNQRILDTHLGSGSSAIAAHYFGCEFVGCELDQDYFNASIERIKQHTAQISLLDSYDQVQRDEYEQRDLL